LETVSILNWRQQGDALIDPARRRFGSNSGR